VDRRTLAHRLSESKTIRSGVTHRDRKVVLSSTIYAPTFGSVHFRIEGYTAAGGQGAAADDPSRLYIDNVAPDFNIDDVSMQGQPAAIARCSTSTASSIPPLPWSSMRTSPERFMNDYAVSLRKGNIGGFGITGLGPGQLSGAYVHGDDLACSSFEGTFDDPTHNGSGQVDGSTSLRRRRRQPVAPTRQPFCTFAVNLGCSVRKTNGYNSAVQSAGTAHTCSEFRRRRR